MRASLLLVVFALGCGGTVVDERAATDAGGDTRVGDAAALSDCATICSARAAVSSSEGFCNPILVGGDAGMPGPQPCESWCDAQWAMWSLTERAAFERCAKTDPLCFLTTEQCMKGP